MASVSEQGNKSASLPTPPVGSLTGSISKGTSYSICSYYKAYVWAAAVVIACITFSLYLPALNNGFVNWDDGTYVYDNYAIRTLGAAFFKWAFTTEVIGHWHPLTMLSYALDYAVWGLEPWGYHLTNNLFHALNTLLVFLLTVKVVSRNGTDEGRQKKTIVAGCVTALLFGIHPLHVESVAWVSERKDVLSAFFYLSSLLAYLSYASAINSRKVFYYVICLLFFVMALMSKAMAVSLPVVLLILDFYPHGRLSSSSIKAVLFEKLPFFLLSISASGVAILAHQSRDALASAELFPIVDRLFVAGRAYVFYLVRMVLPSDLAPLYPYPVEFNFLGMEYLGSLVLLVAVTFLCIKSLKRSRLLPAVWLYYIVTLIPVIGIVQVGSQAAADRYTYLPSLGPFMLIGLGSAYVYDKGKSYQIAVISALLLISGFLANKTVKQIAIWNDSLTLWTHQIKIFPDSSAIPYVNLGAAYLKAGDVTKAIEFSEMAIEIDPQCAGAYINRGRVYDGLGDYEKSVQDYNAAIELDPRNAKAYYNRGNSYFKADNYISAIRDYDKSVELNPQYFMAYYNLGTAYNSAGNYQGAIKAFTRAIELDPGDTRAYTNRGSSYSNLGDYRAAIEDFSLAVKLDPRNTPAYYNLGVAYSQIGDAEKSIANYKKAADLGLKEAQEYLKGRSGND